MMRHSAYIASAAILLSFFSPGAFAQSGEQTVTEFRTGEDIFRMPMPKDYKGPLAMCKVCGKPLAEHSDPNFVCSDPTRAVERPSERTAKCPVCNHRFIGFIPLEDADGGIDSDLCRHPRGSVSFASEFWLCPSCGYAAVHHDFERPVAKELAAAVRKDITQGTKEMLRRMVGLNPKGFVLDDFSFLTQDAIPEYLKSENAVAVALLHDLPSSVMGRIYLNASHTYRRMLCEPVVAAGLEQAVTKVQRLLAEASLITQDPYEQMREATSLLTRTSSNGKPLLNARDRLLVKIHLAGLHDRLGETWWSWKHLRESEEIAASEAQRAAKSIADMKKTGATPPTPLQAVAAGSLMDLVQYRSHCLQRQSYHQLKAIDHYRLALSAGTVFGGERRLTSYLIGELLARSGDIARARPWLEAVARLTDGRADDAEANRLNRWSRLRLQSAAFGSEGDAVAADAEEAVFVERVLAGEAVEPAPATAREADPPPAIEPAKKVAPPASPAVEAPTTCRQQMEAIWSAIERHVRETGEYPPNLDALVRRGFIGAESSGNFQCVESGRKLFYRRPPDGSARTFILYHADPASSTCRNILHSDGTITEMGR